MRYIYNKLERPSKRARKNYQKYLGFFMHKFIKKSIPGFQQPCYFKSSDYVVTGNIIVMKGDADYFKFFPQNKEKIFQNQMPDAYFFLANKLP